MERFDVTIDVPVRVTVRVVAKDAAEARAVGTRRGKRLLWTWGNRVKGFRPPKEIDVDGVVTYIGPVRSGTQ